MLASPAETADVGPCGRWPAGVRDGGNWCMTGVAAGGVAACAPGRLSAAHGVRTSACAAAGTSGSESRVCGRATRGPQGISSAVPTSAGPAGCQRRIGEPSPPAAGTGGRPRAAAARGPMDVEAEELPKSVGAGASARAEAGKGAAAAGEDTGDAAWPRDAAAPGGLAVVGVQSPMHAAGERGPSAGGSTGRVGAIAYVPLSVAWM